MTSLSRKRKWAGEPVKDKKKIVPESPKKGHKPKPKEHGLVIRHHISYYTEETRKYPSKAARDQAIAYARKQAEIDVKAHWRWYKSYRKDLTFEEFDA